MKIMVTGGAGFIGSAVIRHIIEETEHSVLNIDSLTYAGSLESLNNISENSRYDFIKLDIVNNKELDKIFKEKRPDAVMHLAAESHVDRSISSPEIFIHSNILGTYYLLECTRKYWLNLSSGKKDSFRFHHISTDEVYGDLESDEEPFNEKTPYSPSSPYSASKASSDHLVRAWHRTFGLPVMITNCSNNYGPFHYPEKLIPLVILKALEGDSIPVYGKGDQVRDWLYVVDHAEALLQVVTRGKVGETYNIGGFNEMKNIDVVNQVCSLLDELQPKESGSYRDQITFVEDRPGHDTRYAIDASKINNEIGWFPRETFESGIKKTVEWFLENKSWCDNKTFQGEKGIKK